MQLFDNYFGFDEQGAGETASSEQVDEPVQEQPQEVTPPPTESTPVVTDAVSLTVMPAGLVPLAITVLFNSAATRSFAVKV